MGLFNTTVLVGAALLAVGFVVMAAVVAGVVVWLKRTSVRADDRRRMLDDLGFVAVNPPFEALAERLARIHRCKPRAIHVRSVSRKDVAGGAICLLSYHRTDDDDTGSGCAFALILSGLDLPVFAVYPKTPETGWAGKMGNRLAQAARYAVGSKPVDTSAHPAFDTRYSLTSPEPDAALTAIPAPLLDHLGTTEWLILEGAGDTMLIEVRAPGKTFAPVDKAYLDVRLRHAAQLAGTLGQTAKRG
jgi:hypothetical protein